MIVVKVRDREIRVAPTAPVTSGSVGLPVTWTFSEEWEGLTKTAVFRGSDTARDVFLTDDVCVVPAEVLEQSGGPLEIGVRGVKITHDEDTDEDIVTVVIPTIWGRIDRIYDGTIPSEADPSVPEPDWTEQVKAAATEALSKATAVEEAAARGDFDGVSPEVTIAEITHGHSVTISDRDHPEGQSFPVLDGASAYEQAAAGGYEGTEAEFNADLAGFSEKEQTATSAAAAAAQSAQNAANSASTAATKAGEAAQSAATASTHKDAADSSAQAAANSATSANSSANAASTSAGAASASAASASTSAQNAAGSASTASTAAATAQRHATNAEASATAAGRSATAADNSAQAAAQSAQSIEEYEHDAEAWAIGKRGGTDVDSSDETYQNNSKYYAEQAAASSSAASSAASEASQSATDAASEAASSKSYSRSSYISSTMASGSATAAAEAQTAAETAASTAEGHATNAASSATAASGSATAAAQSATEAGNASTAATTAKEAAEDAQEAAETAAQSVSQSAAQIATNTSDIGELKSAVNEVTGNTYNLVIAKLLARTVNQNGGIVNWGDTTDMVIAPISEGVTYTIKTDDTSGFVGAFYSTVPNYDTTMSYNNSRVVQASKTFVAPINGYVAFRTGHDYIYAQIVEGSIDLDYMPPETAIDRMARRDIALLSKNKLDGKVLCCCGDSITYGADMDAEGITDTSNITMYQCNEYGIFSKVTSGFLKTWGYQIAERNNMIFYNGGVSGSTVQGILGKYGFSLSGGRYTRLPDIIDYLLLWFGWNDTAYGTLGTIDDTTNQSYYGGFNVVLPYLIEKYPYAKIALIVPFGTDANHREAIRLLGNKWGVAVWDNYEGGTPLYYGKEESVGVEQSVVLSNRAKFQANGAHPNYRGHKQLGDMIEDFIKSI